METQKKNVELGAVFLALAGAILFSAKAVMVKLAYNYEIDPVSLLLLRMGFALPFYIAIALRSKNPTGSQPTQKDYLWVVVMGFVGYYLASYFDFYGLQFIDASLERLILFVYPTLVLLISWLVLRKAIAKIQMVAILITYLGIYVAFMDKLSPGSSSNPLLGGIFIFLSALTYAIYLIGSGQLLPKFGTKKFTSYAMIVSCICVIAHFSIQGSTQLFGYPWEVYALGLGMALFSTVFPSFLISEAIKRIGASTVSIIGSVGPISTIILASIFLYEHISAYQIAGTAIVISGIILVGRSKGKKKETEKAIAR
ncbi:DMT family transporter [Flammeovirgaceae bacterium SG7u.111]|nr:DMT family transporter [Flammeovirgaceae bacterium SG7u.132]WPO37768.1 DMT family transporter [Flammeovirgaceae bacterium SG7u.111]